MRRGRRDLDRKPLIPKLSLRSPFSGRIDVDEIYLNAGELVFATRPCLIRTVLGSCVGIALHDPWLGIGGMCHYLLADGPEEFHSTKFGSVAIRTLIGKFKKAGSIPGRLRAWMAGGGLLLDSSEVFFVGDRNVMVADEILKEFGISPLAREVGGGRGRRMILNTGTGETLISVIPVTDMAKLLVF